MFVMLYKNEFVYAKRKVWYQFSNHRWIILDEAMSLKQRLSKDLVKEYQHLRSSFVLKQQDLDSDDPRTEDLEKDIKKCASVMTKLKQTSFKKNVLEECQELFYVEGFENMLDNNPYLIGFDKDFDYLIRKFTWLFDRKVLEKDPNNLPDKIIRNFLKIS